KTYDPVGELYYETLRYLQGLPPTPQAFSNLTDAFADGYPVYTTWVDPLPAVPGLGNTGDYSCVNTNILTIGDIHTHYDRSLPGYTGGNSNDFARNPVYNLAGNEPNFKDWTTTVGVYEGRTNLQNETSQDDGSYYMAGAAYWAHVQDFRGTTWTTDPDKRRPGMRVKTYIIDVDEYGQSSGSAATRRSSELYLAAKYGGFSDVSKTGNPFLNAAGEPDLTSNWQQDNGDAKTYFLAGNPQAMLEAIKQIFQQIVNQANSIAGAAIDTQALQTGDGDSYQAQFDPNFWSGNVLAKTLRRNPDGSVSAADATVRWDASQLLGARTSAQPRNIVVGRRKEDVSSSGAATNFIWANLDTWAKEALQTPANAATPVVLDSDTVGSNRLSYLRGDRSLESPAGTFRARGGLIGDIVNSGVTYKAEPDPSLADAGYAAFYNGLFDTSTKLLKRKKALYVGANDGMLHSFDAATGNELFAYIPSFVVPALTQLTNPSYIHRAYVDATPVIAEAQLDTSSATTWKTVLVSGAGGGGQGVFALDVTDPSAFGPSKVLWEFTELDDADLGNVVGAPRIVKIRTSGSSGAILYKWYAVVGGGVNSNADDGHFNENGNAALFFLELGKPVTQPWSLGTNYFKVMFTQISHTLPYGMLAFNVQTGPASELVRLYGGDLQGNFWKLNFSSTSQANGVDVNVAAVLTAGGTKQADTPLFTATAVVNGVAAVQPITAPPGIATGLNNTTLVAFGTGKFLEASDISGPYGQAQTFYTLLDDNLHRFTGRGSLIPLTASGGVLTGESFTWGSVNGGKLGWYLDLPNFTSGERQISDVLIRSGQLFFNTVIPAQGGCDPGSGNIYGPIDLVTGIGTYLKSIEGLPGAPMTQDIASEPGDLSPPDSTGRRKKIGSVQVLNSNSADFNAGAIYKLPPAAYGRLSWRQIMNYQELHHNATTP
ncbi:MAG: hypothetical protein JWP52_2348, partial [Rhizobacter sp.]|nr:hypothetical protein [Rhizobacter sp.]